MVGIDDLALALARAIATEVSKRAGRGIAERTKVALGRDPGRQALQRALREALERFDTAHAVWSKSFFDQHFLESRAAPLLARMISSGDPPTSRELATAWREQFGPGASGIEEVEPVAAAFLRILREELRAEDEFRAVLDSRAYDAIAEAVVAIARAIAGSSASRRRLAPGFARRPLGLAGRRGGADVHWARGRAATNPPGSRRGRRTGADRELRDPWTWRRRKVAAVC